MKRNLILLLFVIFFTCSCSTYKITSNVNYDVCYPDTTITYNKNVNMYVSSKNEYNEAIKNKKYYNIYDLIKDNVNVIAHSFDGTNYLTIYINYTENKGFITGDHKNIISTTAPIRLNSYKVINIEKYKKKKK